MVGTQSEKKGTLHGSFPASWRHCRIQSSRYSHVLPYCSPDFEFTAIRRRSVSVSMSLFGATVIVNKDRLVQPASNASRKKLRVVSGDRTINRRQPPSGSPGARACRTSPKSIDSAPVSARRDCLAFFSHSGGRLFIC